MDLGRLPPDLLLALAWLAALVAFVQTIRLALRSWVKRRRLTLARERGAWGEARAEALLLDRGFTILGRQVAASYGLGVDGEKVAVDLRADYVVAEGDRRYVAEVKTGVFAPRLETAATRRQLLEYRIAFDVDGVLLVDAEEERVRRVDFPLPSTPPPPPSRLVWLLAGLAAGVLVMVASRAL